MKSSGGYRKHLFVFCLGTFSILYFLHIQGFVLLKTRHQPKQSLICKGPLASVQPEFSAFLIDIPFLQSLLKNVTSPPKKPLKFAVLEGESVSETEKYRIIQYKRENRQKRYWTFYEEGRIRAIPIIETYRVCNLLIPKDIPKFLEYWKRSRLLNCLKLDMKRSSSKSFLSPPSSVAYLSRLVALLISLDMYPFLLGGTLLGWYRECGVIPHTWDMDLAVFAEQHNPKLFGLLKGEKTEFRLLRKLGKINDSYELTVKPKMSNRPAIDVFYMYNAGETESWVGGTSGDGRKYKYPYPRYNPWCAADLLGHLFWVTCSPEAMLKFEYGLVWKKDHHTTRFSWSQSSYNVRKNGRWRKEDMSEAYMTFNSSGKTS